MVSPSVYEKDEEVKKQMRIQLANETLPKWFSLLEKRVQRFGSNKFSVGSQFSVADFKLACFFDWFLTGILDHIPTTILDNYPALLGVHDNVYQNEKIKQWIEKTKK